MRSTKFPLYKHAEFNLTPKSQTQRTNREPHAVNIFHHLPQRIVQPENIHTSNLLSWCENISLLLNLIYVFIGTHNIGDDFTFYISLVKHLKRHSWTLADGEPQPLKWDYSSFFARVDRWASLTYLQGRGCQHHGHTGTALLKDYTWVLPVKSISDN